MERHELSEHDLEEVGAQMMIELQRVEQLFSDGVDMHGCRKSARQ
jgi:hypothetical protein